MPGGVAQNDERREARGTCRPEGLQPRSHLELQILDEEVDEIVEIGRAHARLLRLVHVVGYASEHVQLLHRLPETPTVTAHRCAIIRVALRTGRAWAPPSLWESGRAYLEEAPPGRGRGGRASVKSHVVVLTNIGAAQKGALAAKMSSLARRPRRATGRARAGLGQRT